MTTRSVVPCDFCGFDVPISRDRCPHCARLSLFPNVTQAEDPVQMNALERRYQKAFGRLDPAVVPVFEEFENAVANQSEAVITRYATELFRLAASEKEIFASFYDLVSSGVRLPSEGFWDTVREAVDSKLFNYHRGHILFAALSLNRRGLSHYGDCFLILKENMIAHRSTVFEENSIVFMHRRKIRITEELPVGYRASWPNRGRLAVTKQAATLNSDMTLSDFPTLLAAEGANPEDDRFVEVHIYGSISIHTVAEVSLPARGTAIRRKALLEKLAKYGIPVKKH